MVTVAMSGRTLTGGALPYQPIINITNAGDVVGAEAPNALPPLIKTTDTNTNTSEYALAYDVASLEVDGAQHKLRLATAVKTKIDTHETTLTTHGNNISTLQSSVLTNAGEITTLKNPSRETQAATVGMTDGLVGDTTVRSYPPTTALNKFLTNTSTITGETYGNGRWEFAQSTVNSGYEACYGFKQPAQTTGNMNGAYSSAGSQFNGTTGAYTGSSTTTAVNGTVTAGDIWSCIPPAPKRLVSVTLVPRSTEISIAPKDFTIFCRLPGATLFTSVFTATGRTWAVGVPQTFTLTTPTDFVEMRLVTQAIGGGPTSVQFGLSFSATSPSPGAHTQHIHTATVKTLAADTSVTTPRLHSDTGVEVTGSASHVRVINGNAAAPTKVTRSSGTRVVLHSWVGPNATDYALGIGSSTLWSSVADVNAFFRWYAADQNIMTLDGNGSMSQTGNLNSGLKHRVMNASAANNAWSQYEITNDSTVGAAWFINSSTRTLDGGANTATLRNDIGTLRLQSKGGKGLTIAADTGGITLDAGPVIFPQNINPPSVTTRSLGTRLCLYQGVTATNVDYAIGVENGALWYSASTTGDVHKFYTGPTHVATIGNNYIGLHRADAPISYELATNISLARSGGVGHYFTGSVAGDACIRNTTNRIMLGASASTAHLTINTNGSIDMPGPTQMTSAVNGIYRFINAKNTSTANGAYTMLNLENSGTAGFNWFLNGTATTVEGGANSGTLRNDAGQLRLQAQGSKGITIAPTTGNVTMEGTLSSVGNVNGGHFMTLQNTSAGTSGFAMSIVQANAAYGLATYVNSTTRTEDGGVNTATIRNDAGGSLRLQTTGSKGITIAPTTGNVTVDGTLTVGGQAIGAGYYTYTSLLPTATGTPVTFPLTGPDHTNAAVLASNRVISVMAKAAGTGLQNTWPPGAATFEVHKVGPATQVYNDGAQYEITLVRNANIPANTPVIVTCIRI